MKKKQSDFMMLLKGVGGGIIALVLGSLLLSGIVSSMDNPVKYIEYAAVLSAFLGGVVCGLICCKEFGKNALTFSLVSGVSIAVLFVIAALLGGNGGSLIVRLGTPLTMIIGSILPALFNARSGRKKNPKKKIKQIRKKFG